MELTGVIYLALDTGCSAAMLATPAAVSPLAFLLALPFVLVGVASSGAGRFLAAVVFFAGVVRAGENKRMEEMAKSVDRTQSR